MQPTVVLVYLKCYKNALKFQNTVDNNNLHEIHYA